MREFVCVYIYVCVVICMNALKCMVHHIKYALIYSIYLLFFPGPQYPLALVALRLNINVMQNSYFIWLYVLLPEYELLWNKNYIPLCFRGLCLVSKSFCQQQSTVTVSELTGKRIWSIWYVLFFRKSSFTRFLFEDREQARQHALPRAVYAFSTVRGCRGKYLLLS